MKTGRAFENEVHEWLLEAVQEGVLGIIPGNVRVDLRYGLYSRDRDSKIIFDIVLRVYRKSAKEPFLFWLWECKDYEHSVPVDDVEEFHSKIEQVGRDNTKGTMVSRSGFQAGATKFARANGIGLMRVVPKEEAVRASRYPSAGGSLIGALGRLFTMVSVIEAFPTPLFAEESSSRSLNELIAGASSPENCYILQNSSGELVKCETWNQVLALASDDVLSIEDGTE